MTRINQLKTSDLRIFTSAYWTMLLVLLLLGGHAFAETPRDPEKANKSKESTVLATRVVEIQMEEAIKERIMFLQKKQIGTTTARSNGDSVKPDSDQDVWRKLEQSVESKQGL